MLIVLLIVGLIVLLVATWKYPPISLAFFITTAVFKLFLMLKFSFFRVVDYTVLCAILVLIAMVFSSIKYRRWLRDIVSMPSAVYLLLAAFLLLGTTYTSAPNYGLEKSSRFATLGLIAFLGPIVLARGMKEIKLIIWIIVVGGVLLTIVTLIFPHVAQLRPSAAFRGAFLEASALTTASRIGEAATIFFLFAIMVHTPGPLKIASLILIPLMLAGMVVTGSRGPFLGLILTWLVAVLICRKGTSKVWVPIITTITLIALVISFARLPEIITMRIASMWRSPYDMERAAYSRTERFLWTVERFQERPLLGHGTGAFAVDRGGEDIRAYPHNIFLELLYEQGLVGAVILSLFLWLIFRRWRLASRLVHLYELDIGIFHIVHIAGLLFLFEFTQAMKSNDIDGNRSMFFLAGLVVAVSNLVRRTAEDISLENELIPEQQQDFEGFEFQDARILY